MGSDDYQRTLGIVEAITVITNQCPNHSVRAAAELALEASKNQDTTMLKQQVFLVLTSMRGWRGDRAEQVNRSLNEFLQNSSES